MDRRRFIRSSAIAVTGVMLSQNKAQLAGKRRKKVVVLGAGLAGLAAAWELDQAGHDVVVLEARTRPGGRVLTLREGFSPGLSAEAGAMSFSDGYPHLLRYVKLFHVPYEPLGITAIRGAGEAALYYLKGRRLHAKPDGTVDWPFDLTDEERTLDRIGILRRYLLSVFEGVGESAPSETMPNWARPYDTKTLLEVARERGASPGACDLIRSTFWFADVRNQESAAACLLADLSLYYRGQTAYGFPGGDDALPLAFAARLRERIRYGTEVVRIAQHPDRVEIGFHAGGMLDRISADRAVCTIPFSVLRHIDVTPAFSPSKREVVSGLGYRPVTRVFLQMSRRFWTSEGVAGAAMTDLPIGQVQEHPIFPTGAEGERAILEAHVRGDAVAPLDAMSEDDRLRFVLEEMEKVHPGVGKHYEGGLSKSWQDDPWARGAFASFRRGQMTGWLPKIVRPEGRIHFAGEHTSIHPATMEGAIESGVRVAREVGEA